MSFLELARTRRSVRRYDPRPVPEDKLNAVLEAGRVAPSAANRQPWHFVVITDPQVKTRLKDAYPRDWFYTAPVIIVVCVEPAAAWTRSDGKNYADVDGAIAMDHMTLCAADLGLGTCWIAAFNPDVVREVLGLPERIVPLVMTPLGFPADTPSPKNRKPLGAILHRERWH